MSNLISPLPFCHRLSAEYEPLTYTTLTFHREGEVLCLHITCFEKIQTQPTWFSFALVLIFYSFFLQGHRLAGQPHPAFP